MIPTSSVIKRNAKAALSNKWSSALAVSCMLLSSMAFFLVLLQLFMMLVPEQSNELLYWAMLLVVFLVSQVFLAPVIFGCIRWFWFVSDGANLSVSSVFYFFESWNEYKRALLLSYFMFMRVMGVILLCFIPYAAILIIGSPELYNSFDSGMPYWVSLVWVLSELAVFFGIILSIALLLRFILAPVLMINDNNLSPKQALRMSVLVTKGAVFSFVGLTFSFVLWFIYGLLVLPLLFITPYYLCSFAVYCRNAIGRYNYNIDMLSRTRFPYYRSNF